MRQSAARANGFPRGKFAPPEPGVDLIARRTLVDQLQTDIQSKPLVLVVAPAGYGKTVVMRACHDRMIASGQAAYWYNCDPSDVVPVALSAFLRRLAEPAGDFADSDRLGFEDGGPVVAGMVAAALDARRQHTTVVLENYHLAQSPDCDELIEALLAAGSRFLHLVITSRTRPSFASRKLALTGQVAECRARDLAFNRGELAELCLAAVPDLDDADIDALSRTTEGWPAAVRLFLLAMQRGGDRRRLLREIASRDADLTDYLVEEVLRGLPVALDEFLVGTGFLNQFNAGICTAVLPGLDGSAMIAQAEQNNLFIAEIEPGSGWFRYHPTFRQCLLNQFRRLPEPRQREMRLAASRALEAEGLHAEGIDQALMAQDVALARDVLLRHASDMVSARGNLASYLHLLARFPRAVVEGEITLQYWKAWAMFFSRQYREAARLVAGLHAAVEHSPADIPEGDMAERIGLLDALSAVFTDDMESALRAGNDWLRQFPDAAPFDRSTVACGVVLAHLASFDLRSARTVYGIAQRAIADTEGNYGRAWVCGVGMAMDLLAGEPRSALARLAAIDGWDDNAQTPGNISSTLSLLAAAAHYHLDEIADAERLAQVGLPMLAEHGVSETASFALAACLRVRAIRRGTGEALTLAREIEATLVKAYAPRLELTLRYERALMLYRANRLEDAQEEAAAIVGAQPTGEILRNEAAGELPSVREMRQIVAVRLALAERTWNEALRLLSGIISSARHSGRHLRLVQALLLKARAHYGQADPVRAARAFLEAVQVAAPRGLLRIFLDDHLISRPLLASVLANRPDGADDIAAEVEAAFLQQLQGRLGLDAVVGPPPELTAPLEPLTPREQVMAEMLNAGLRNREIALRLAMSEATVKWHLYNLYSKLGVNNRTAAIHRARSLGMVKI